VTAHTYAVRPDLFSGPRTYTLDDDALAVQDGSVGWMIWIAAVYEGAVSVVQAVVVFGVLALATLLAVRSAAMNKERIFDPANPPLR
jgi:hypothetical protein